MAPPTDLPIALFPDRAACRAWLAAVEAAGSFPSFFHYVNVGPGIRAEQMITDVHLPLR